MTVAARIRDPLFDHVLDIPISVEDARRTALLRLGFFRKLVMRTEPEDLSNA